MSCAPYPVQVRLGNVTLPTNQVARGMNMSIGEPRQQVALLPLWPLNNTIIYGTNGYCLDGSPNSGTWTDTACATFRGGAYDSISSTSVTNIDASAYPDDSAPDDSEGDSKYPQVTHVADSLTLNDNITLGSFPLSVALSDWGAQAYTPMMGIGLGTNSTLLNVLKSTGKIASRSYSYFWGLAAAGTSAGSLDGSVVFGGYDKAKVTGSRYTQAMTDNVDECPSQLLVTIADIVLNFANGTDASIFPASKSTSLTACLTPGLSTLMRMPLNPYFANMMALASSNTLPMSRTLGIYYWNMRYEAPGPTTPYEGDMTIKLQSGLSVRISNNQLVRPHTEVDQHTGAINVNTTSPDLVIDSLQATEATKLAQIGWQFFTAAYLHVNQDTKQFTLWQANPTAKTDLVAVDSAGNDISTFCSESPASTPSVSASPSPDNGRASSSSPSLVGIIVGSIAGAVVIAVVAFFIWWYRRRRARRAEGLAQLEYAPYQPTAFMMENASQQYPGGLPSKFANSELEGASAIPPAELPTGQYYYTGRGDSGTNKKELQPTSYELSG